MDNFARQSKLYFWILEKAESGMRLRRRVKKMANLPGQRGQVGYWSAGFEFYHLLHVAGDGGHNLLLLVSGLITVEGVIDN